MTREDLEKLGLNEEQITGVMKLKSSAMSNSETEINNLKTTIGTLTTEKNNLTTQIEDANKEIQSYKDLDIDSIRQSASDWETKYNELVENQKVEKEKSIRMERTNAFFDDVKFSSEMAKAGVIAKFNEKDFKYDEESKSFQGAKEWLEELKESDANSFLSDVANPSFSMTPQAPTQSSSMDDVMKVMGLSPEKK